MRAPRLVRAPIRWCACILFCLVLIPAERAVGAEEVSGVGPLQHSSLSAFLATLSPRIQVLHEPAAMESFLAALDGTPPDWSAIHGHGHHDPGHDDRLFSLNRVRDAEREGNPVLQTPLAFVWSGELSRLDPDTGGYSVALGPVFTPTAWGQVRFKPVDLPGELLVVPGVACARHIRHVLEQGKPLEIAVVFIGRLVPEESLVYDFSHDQEGLGLIMPFVRVEQVHYLWEQPAGCEASQ